MTLELWKDILGVLAVSCAVCTAINLVLSHDLWGSAFGMWCQYLSIVTLGLGTGVLLFVTVGWLS